MPISAAVTIGNITLKNPVICASTEYTMTCAGIRNAIHSGAGAVIAKSTNESVAAKKQLDKTDYRLFDSAWNPLPWDFNAPDDAILFCRSGLIQKEFKVWMQELIELDQLAKSQQSYVIPSLILADLDRAAESAKYIESLGFRALEFNIGAPHGDEAAKGAIILERAADRVKVITQRIREAINIPLWIKLTGQSENVAALVQAAKDGGADAVIVMGRLMGFIPDLTTHKPVLNTNAAIGGGWALPLACRWLAKSRACVGKDYPLLGTNGARTGLDIARFLLSGAYAVEMGSIVLAQGAVALSRAVSEFEAYLTTQNIDAQALIGRAADQIQTYADQTDRTGIWQQFIEPAAQDNQA